MRTSDDTGEAAYIVFPVRVEVKFEVWICDAKCFGRSTELIPLLIGSSGPSRRANRYLFVVSYVYHAAGTDAGRRRHR